MKKKDRAGENIVCLLDDFRMIGENGFHILLLQVLSAKPWAGLAGWCKTQGWAPVRRMSRAAAEPGHTEVAGGERLDKEIFGCSGGGQKVGGGIFSPLVNP